MGQKIDKRWDIEGFLRDYPGMALAPFEGERTVIAGTFDFVAEAESHGRIADSYELRFCVSGIFPKELPVVFETGRRIPRSVNYHVNSDGSLCLGSPLRLLLILAKAPTLPRFAKKCVEPYLFAMSYKFMHGGPFPFGELIHGAAGATNDYMAILGLTEAGQVREALKCLRLEKRQANKRPCPCGCKKRLGSCKFNLRLSALRDQIGRQKHNTFFGA